ncbi:MAG: hypothetical protein QOF48_2765 [Verrucomicrobiota bacterium]|jgi:hypothetical protein
MSETFAPFVQWLEQAAPFQGGLACAVRSADGHGASRSWVVEYGEDSLEHALRCVADLFQVIHHNRIAPGRVRWVFGAALLHCERRPDGACLGIFTAHPNGEGFDAECLERMFVEFQNAGVPGSVSA